LSRDLGIDLGTASTLVYASGRGVVLHEPSVVALDLRNGAVVALGREAEALLGRGPAHIEAVRPLRHGAIVDFDVTQRLLRLLSERAGVSRFHRARVVICVPSALTEVERRAVLEAARRAGASDARLLDQPMAAAIGAGLPVNEALGTMVVDVGAGKTEAAVLSLGGAVASRAVRVGCFDFDTAIQTWMRRAHGLAVPERTAEEIRRTVGSAAPVADEVDAEVRGLDVTTGVPRHVEVDVEEIRQAMAEPLAAMCGAVVSCLGATPPDLAHDLVDQGIHLVGGGSLVAGIDTRLAEETGLAVRRVAAPLEAVVLGAGRCIESDDAFRAVLAGGQR